MSKDAARTARLERQLRANLARRKQARAMPAEDDQRANASDPSDVAAPAAR